MLSLILNVRRSRKLHQWRNFISPLPSNLLLLRTPPAFFTNPFSSATASDLTPEEDERKRRTFTVSYLINSLGLTTKLAESISSKANFDEKRNPDSVLKLLRSYGFTDPQISTIITTYPRFLVENPEKTLRAKLHFLKLNGASSSELTEIVSKVPKILGRRGHVSITGYFDYVKEILQDQDKNSKNVKQTNRTRNVSVLRELGVPQKLLLNLLISKAKPVCGKERFEESVKKIIAMGFDPTSKRFVNALYVFYELSEKTIEHKVGVYKKLGLCVDEVWSTFKKWPYLLKYSEKKITQTFESLRRCGLTDEEVRVIVKKYPECVGTSEEKIVGSVETFVKLGFTGEETLMIIKRHPQCIGLAADTVRSKTEFLVEKMGWSLKDVASTPIVLGFSLEKFIFPRCNVIRALVSKGLIGEVPAISSALTSPKQRFLKNFVKKHEKVLPELIYIFTGDRVLVA